MSLINYQSAKKFISDSLIEECIERRHITLGWQHAGNIGESIRRLVEASVGQFRKQISGVPIALGAIRLLKPIYILEDHNCMHIDFEVQMIVLKVQPGERSEGEGEKVIRCQANQILNKGVVGTAFGNIGVVCSPAPHGIKVGDTFSACFMGVKFRNSICQLQTIPLSVSPAGQQG